MLRNNKFGIIIGFLFGYLTFALNPLSNIVSWLPKKDIILFSGITYGLVEMIFIELILGFLIGWAIHSLVRVIKR